MIRLTAIEPQRGMIGQRADLRTLHDGGRQERDQDREHAELAVEPNVVKDCQAIQRADGDQGRHQKLDEDELSDQDAALEYDRFVHR